MGLQWHLEMLEIQVLQLDIYRQIAVIIGLTIAILHIITKWYQRTKLHVIGHQPNIYQMLAFINML